eukprot:5779347-Ditylum_brightwellii.AAC.1
MEGVFVWRCRGLRGRGRFIVEGAANPVLELSFHFVVVELAAVNKRGTAFSSSEVSGSTMEVSSPSASAGTGTFNGDKGGNLEGDIHRK